MDDETLVDWREWGPAPFEEAAAADRPVACYLTAPWCTWCAEMDREVWSNPTVAANLHDDFVPVRVDADRHPDVRERYQPGGFPATAFLTPEGEVLSATTYLGLEGMRSVLERVREAWDARGDRSPGQVPRALREAPPAGDLSEAVVTHAREQVAAAFDEEFGGWGTDAKFPLPRTVEFALARDRDRALRTLEAIRTHLYDTYDGGFFRYAEARDWSDPHREKLTDETAAICRAFASAYLVTGDAAYRDPAEGTVEYLTTTLWTGEAFAGSQAGDADYYRLEPTEREAADPPAVDDTVFADRNTLAAAACLRVAAVTDHEGARRYAERALEHVRDHLIDGGRVAHFAGGPGGLLGDQARTLAALTTAAQVLGPQYLPAARSVADWTGEHLWDGEAGAFRDRPAGEAPALLARPLYPLDPTVDLADALVDLSVLTGEAGYRERAREALSAFAGAADRMGVDVAAYATATARVLDPPLAIRVADDPGSDLHRAALRMADHEKVVVPDADGERGTATVDGGELAATPAELEARVAAARDGRAE
jgi:hypothetical protein